ncbi:hypothetical protein BJ742DRAFT_767341 [Cladochytrium replicatum]|nr:hypothetical protein BJ742DRAFT_767341 [Cladochytrium replicatum]
MRSSTIHTLRPKFKWFTFGFATLAVHVVKNFNYVSDLDADLVATHIPSNVLQTSTPCGPELGRACYHCGDLRREEEEDASTWREQREANQRRVLFYTMVITARASLAGVDDCSDLSVGWSMLLNRIMESSSLRMI